MDASSFLEADSFLDLPPLRPVNKNFSLSNLCTMLLGETVGTKYEFGNIQQNLKLVSSITFEEFYTEDILAVLDRAYHRVMLYQLTEEYPNIGMPQAVTHKIYIFFSLCRASHYTQTGKPHFKDGSPSRW